jgi:hypothetical protein
MTIPSGMVNAIFTNVGTAIILKIVPLLKLKSRHI